MLYIHAVNIGLAAAVVVGIAAEYLADRGFKAAFWWMLSFIALMLHGIATAVAPVVFSEPVAAFVAFLLSAFAISFLNAGVALYYGGKPHWRLIKVVFAAVVLTNFGVLAMFTGSNFASAAEAVLLVGAQATGIFILLGTKRGRHDRVFLTILVLYTLNLASRPFFEAFAPGAGAVAMEINNTLVMIILANILMLRLGMQLLKNKKRESETDCLSGLLNRHGFQTALDKARRVPQSVVPASLVLCDLDFFKSINDKHGHYVGDGVIAAFGKLMRVGAREGDICGRIGGEEFCIYLRNCDAGAARLFAEWLRVAFSSMRYPGLDTHANFTASFGVAEFNRGDTLETAYRRADKALYTAKRNGRNCVRLESGIAEPAVSERRLRPSG
ncbi:MAG: GGDEF domain-containing protein [Pseudomonadota bacterium]